MKLNIQWKKVLYGITLIIIGINGEVSKIIKKKLSVQCTGAFFLYIF